MKSSGVASEPLPVSRAADLDVIRECMEREGGLGEFVWSAKSLTLRPLLDRNRVPEKVTLEALMIFGEAVSNYFRHTNAPLIRIYCSVQRLGWRRVLRMKFTYRTPLFDSNPPPPPLDSESGRGIQIMRELSSAAIFHFEDGCLHLEIKMEWEELF